MDSRQGAGAVVAGIIRGVVVAILLVATFWVFDLADGDQIGANIGAGLAAFALVVVVSGVWSVVDGRRRGIASAAVVWVVATVVFVLVNAVRDLMTGGGLELDVLSFIGGLVLVPGLVGAAIGGATADERSG